MTDELMRGKRDHDMDDEASAGKSPATTGLRGEETAGEREGKRKEVTTASTTKRITTSIVLVTETKLTCYASLTAVTYSSHKLITLTEEPAAASSASSIPTSILTSSSPATSLTTTATSPTKPDSSPAHPELPAIPSLTRTTTDPPAAPKLQTPPVILFTTTCNFTVTSPHLLSSGTTAAADATTTCTNKSNVPDLHPTNSSLTPNSAEPTTVTNHSIESSVKTLSPGIPDVDPSFDIPLTPSLTLRISTQSSETAITTLISPSFPDLVIWTTSATASKSNRESKSSQAIPEDQSVKETPPVQSFEPSSGSSSRGDADKQSAGDSGSHVTSLSSSLGNGSIDSMSLNKSLTAGIQQLSPSLSPSALVPAGPAIIMTTLSFDDLITELKDHHMPSHESTPTITIHTNDPADDKTQGTGWQMSLSSNKTNSPHVMNSTILMPSLTSIPKSSDDVTFTSSTTTKIPQIMQTPVISSTPTSIIPFEDSHSSIRSSKSSDRRIVSVSLSTGVITVPSSSPSHGSDFANKSKDNAAATTGQHQHPVGNNGNTDAGIDVTKDFPDVSSIPSSSFPTHEDPADDEDHVPPPLTIYPSIQTTDVSLTANVANATSITSSTPAMNATNYPATSSTSVHASGSPADKSPSSVTSTSHDQLNTGDLVIVTSADPELGSDQTSISNPVQANASGTGVTRVTSESGTSTSSQKEDQSVNHSGEDASDPSSGSLDHAIQINPSSTTRDHNSEVTMITSPGEKASPNSTSFKSTATSVLSGSPESTSTAIHESHSSSSSSKSVPSSPPPPPLFSPPLIIGSVNLPSDEYITTTTRNRTAETGITDKNERGSANNDHGAADLPQTTPATSSITKIVSTQITSSAPNPPPPTTSTFSPPCSNSSSIATVPGTSNNHPKSSSAPGPVWSGNHSGHDNHDHHNKEVNRLKEGSASAGIGSDVVIDWLPVTLISLAFLLILISWIFGFIVCHKNRRLRRQLTSALTSDLISGKMMMFPPPPPQSHPPLTGTASSCSTSRPPSSLLISHTPSHLKLHPPSFSSSASSAAHQVTNTPSHIPTAAALSFPATTSNALTAAAFPDDGRERTGMNPAYNMSATPYERRSDHPVVSRYLHPFPAASRHKDRDSSSHWRTVSSAASSSVILAHEEDNGHQVTNAMIIIKGDDQESGNKKNRGKKMKKKSKKGHRSDRNKSEFEYVSFIKSSGACGSSQPNLNTPSFSHSSSADYSDVTGIPVPRKRSSLQIQHFDHERNREAEVQVQDYSYSRDPFYKDRNDDREGRGEGMNGRHVTTTAGATAISQKCTLHLIKEKVCTIPDRYFDQELQQQQQHQHQQGRKGDPTDEAGKKAAAITTEAAGVDARGYEYTRLSPGSTSSSSCSPHHRSSRCDYDDHIHDLDEDDQRTMSTRISFRDPGDQADVREQDQHEDDEFGSQYHPHQSPGVSLNQHFAPGMTGSQTYTVVKAIRHELNRFDSITYSHPLHDHHVHRLDLGEDETATTSSHITTETNDQQVLT